MKNRGLTIIEVLFSIIILAIVLAGGMSIYFYLTDLTVEATHKNIAIQLANSKMENLKTKDCAGLIASIGSTAVNIGSFSATQTVTITDTLCTSAYRQVGLQVSWTEPRVGVQIINLDTYM